MVPKAWLLVRKRESAPAQARLCDIGHQVIPDWWKKTPTTANREDRQGKREIGGIWVPGLGVWGEITREGRRWREEKMARGR